LILQLEVRIRGEGKVHREAPNSAEVRLLRELKARLEALVPLEQDRIKYENARQLLGQRLAMKLNHNVDINDYLNQLRWEKQSIFIEECLLNRLSVCYYTVTAYN
jgi:hypothetical protein